MKKRVDVTNKAIEAGAVWGRLKKYENLMKRNNGIHIWEGENEEYGRDKGIKKTK